MPLEIARLEQTMLTQAELLRLQLLEMQTKGAQSNPLYQRGVGRLEAIMWVIGNEKGPKSLMYDNKQIESNEAFWGMF